jgi:branched-chain amino acid transport system substrate-binding protein
MAAALFCAAAAAQAQTGTPIRLGMIDGLSGPFANAGEAVVRNLRIAIERVNARRRQAARRAASVRTGDVR